MADCARLPTLGSAPCEEVADVGARRLHLERESTVRRASEDVGAIGKPLSRNTFRTRVWLPAVEKARIDFGVRVHDLRHAHASWLRAGGADLKGVMERLGHAQLQTTQKYLHSMPDRDQKNLDAFERIVRNKGE